MYTFLNTPYYLWPGRPTRIHNAPVYTCGGYFSNGINPAITLRLLAGRDAYDVGFLFDISTKWNNQMFCHVLEYLIVAPNLGGVDKNAQLGNKEVLQRISKLFSKRSKAILRGTIIGVIDKMASEN